MKLTIKDINLTDMLQADVDNKLVSKMEFKYDNITDLMDAILELENISFNISNQYDNSEEYFVVNTSYGKLKLNRKYFHSVILE